MASFEGTTAPSWLLDEVAAGLGAVALFAPNVHSDAQVADLVATLRRARHDVIVTIDEEGGDVTRLDATTGSLVPGGAALGAVDDVEATAATHRVIGRRLAALGIDLDLAPCADVNIAAANPVIGVRSFSADANVVARHVAAAVRGLQSVGVAACVKHFPGHGATVDDSHRALPRIDVDLDQLRRRELVPFTVAAVSGAAAVMTAHIVVPAIDDLPATRSPRTLGMLRDEQGFTGVIVSDALDMAGVHGPGVSASDVSPVDIGRAAVAALAAGCDLLCLGARQGRAVPAAVVAAIVAAVESGELSIDRLSDAAERVAAIRIERPTFEASAPSAADDVLVAGVARRAITVAGSLPAEVSGALVVDCRGDVSVANFDVHWGLGVDMVALDASAATLDAFPDTEAASIVRQASGRPLVISARGASAHPWQRDLIAAITRDRPDTVVVELGWPDHANPATVTTWGASRASTRAAAQLLLGEPVDGEVDGERNGVEAVVDGIGDRLGQPREGS